MDKKYICHQCGAKYAKPSALAEHRRIWGHHDIFPCDVCHKTFSREDNLRQRRLKHDNTIITNVVTVIKCLIDLIV